MPADVRERDKVPARRCFRCCFLHFQQGIAARISRLEMWLWNQGFFMHEVPADVRFLDAGQSGEHLADAPASLRPPEAHGEAFGEA